MSTSPSLLRGVSPCKALTSVASYLSKTSSAAHCRLTWESDRCKQNAPLPPERLLYLKARSMTNMHQTLMTTLTKEVDCPFDLQPKAVHVYPSRSDMDTRDLLQQLLFQLTCVKVPGQRSLNLWGHVTPEDMIVEYGSPNIAKPLHMGHLRSTVTGNYIAQLCKHAGHNVTSMCFLGDWGTQFGVLQAGLAQWGEGKTVAELVERCDVRSLVNYYIRASEAKDKDVALGSKAKEYSALLEHSDPASLQIWAAIRDKSVEHLKAAWTQLGISFDVMQCESEFAIKSDVTARVLEALKVKGHLTFDPEGRVTVDVPSTLKDAATVKMPLVKSDGSSIYLLRDIAAAVHRSETMRFDRMIYVVDKAQTQHFANLFHVLTNFGFQKVKGQGQKVSEGVRAVEHVAFGQVQGMSTRAGTFLLLSDAVREGSVFMEAGRKNSPNTRWDAEVDGATSLQLTVSALIAYCLKSKRLRDFTFNWADAVRSTGETGMKLQYTHARLKSLEHKQGFDSLELLNDPELFSRHLDAEYLLSNQYAMDLVTHLLNFEDAFWTSYNDLEPCILLTHLFQLCEKTSRALKELPVKTEEDQGLAGTRLRLFALSRHILGIGMNIAGIRPLDQI